MLTGKTAVITGASRGIGLAIALEMAQNGANIALVYIGDEKEGNDAKALIEQTGVTAALYQCDVSDFTATNELIKQIIADFGSIDILVNNAGIVKDALMLRMSEQDYDSVLNVNLKGAFNLIHHIYSHFMKRRAGRIINITSVIGIVGNVGQTNYSASKAGLIGLTKSVARELGGRNVTCNAIAPGFIASDMTDALSDSIKEAALKSIPLKRIGTPKEVADLAVFLASDRASYITGEIIKIDGGYCM